LWPVLLALAACDSSTIDGRFHLAENYQLGVTQPAGFAIGDFDGDGALDLVLGSTTGAPVAVLRGQADGTFAPGPTSDLGILSFAVATGDWDGDGVLDLAALSGPDQDCQLVVLRGRGGGAFERVAMYAVPLAKDLVAADLDGDVRPELVVSAPAAVHVFHNDAGSFVPSGTYATSSASDYMGSIAAGDLDGDLVADIAVATYALGARIDIFHGTGDGQLATPAPIALGLRPDTLAITDVDGDARNDLLFSDFPDDSGRAEVTVLFAGAAGTFTTASTGITNIGPVLPGRFDSDGVPDLVEAGDALRFFHRDGHALEEDPVALEYFGADALRIVDIDGDGTDDIVAVARAASLVQVYRQTPIGPRAEVWKKMDPPPHE
jgi:hypothetical protein